MSKHRKTILSEQEVRERLAAIERRRVEAEEARREKDKEYNRQLAMMTPYVPGAKKTHWVPPQMIEGV